MHVACGLYEKESKCLVSGFRRVVRIPRNELFAGGDAGSCLRVTKSLEYGMPYLRTQFRYKILRAL